MHHDPWSMILEMILVSSIRVCMSCSVTKLLNGDLMNGDMMSGGRLSAGHFRFHSLDYTQKVQFS